MRHPVLEGIPARAATHPPKQPATQEPAESQAATCVTCYTDRVMTRFIQAKNAKPKPVKGAPGRIEPWRGCGARGLNFSPLENSTEPPPPGLPSGPEPLGPLQWALVLLCPAKPGSKNRNAFSWRRGPAASNQGQKPA